MHPSVPQENTKTRSTLKNASTSNVSSVFENFLSFIFSSSFSVLHIYRSKCVFWDVYASTYSQISRHLFLHTWITFTGQNDITGTSRMTIHLPAKTYSAYENSCISLRVARISDSRRVFRNFGEPVDSSNAMIRALKTCHENDEGEKYLNIFFRFSQEGKQ